MMIIYGADGFVRRVVTLAEGVDIHDMLSGGESFIEGFAEPGVDKVVNGELVTAPLRPSAFHVFDKQSFSWVLDHTFAWPIVRAKRQQLLVASDWTQFADVSLPNKAEWAMYRQALRDVTEQSDPLNIVWPVAP